MPQTTQPSAFLPPITAQEETEQSIQKENCHQGMLAALDELKAHPLTEEERAILDEMEQSLQQERDLFYQHFEGRGFRTGERNHPSIETINKMNLWEQIGGEIAAFRAEIRELPVTSHATATELRQVLAERFDFAQPIPLRELTEEVQHWMRTGLCHVTHPRYFGLFNPSVREAGIVADTLVALYNPQMAAWSQSPAAQEIERWTLRHLAGLLGWNPDATFANFASGGGEANHSALLAAIYHRFPEAATAGVGAISRRPCLYLTSETHHSILKAARMTGLGTDSIRLIPTDAQFRMDTSALVRQIEADLHENRTPLFIAGTAGTTGAGLIDPLPEIAEIAVRYGIWFHLDAAWGGSLALSPQTRPLLAGVEQADSVIWDAHKWLSVPMGAGMFFCHHPEAVRRAFAATTSYMPGSGGQDVEDPYRTTAQWSRRFIGLKVFMALAEFGTAGCAALIEHQIRMGHLLREQLQAAGWIVANTTPLPVVCFTHPDIRAGSLTTTQILQTLLERNRVWISEVVLGGQERVLRACITSYFTDETDIACLIAELETAREAGGEGR